MTNTRRKGRARSDRKPHILKTVALPGGLELRPATKADRGFMQQLFASTREHLRRLPLPGPQVELLLEQQYQLQQVHYSRQWPDAETLVIQLAGEAIGKITLEESEAVLKIIDIALEPAMRGRGYGTTILRAFQAVGEKYKLAISLSVDRQNPKAKKLYRNLGFEIIASSATHESMQWQPPTTAVTGESFTSIFNR